MPLSPEQQARLAIILSTPEGRQAFNVVQTVRGLQQQSQDRKDAKEAQEDASNQQLYGTIGGLAGTLGGAYLTSQIASGALAGGAAATGAGGALTAPTLLSVAPTAAGAAGAGAAGAGAAAGSGAAATGAGAASGAAAGGTTAGTIGAYAWPVAAAIAAYQAYKNYDSAKEAADGGNMTDEEVTSIYSPFRGALDKYAGKLGPIAEAYVAPFKWMADNSPIAMLAKAAWGTSKDDDQVYRDRYRKFMQKNGIIDDNFQYTDAQGRKIDMGLDGGARLQNVDTNIDGESDRGTYDVDFSNQLSGQTVGYLNPLAALSLGGNAGEKDKLQSDATGMLTNTALAHATDAQSAQSNALDLYKKYGFKDANSALGALDKIKDKLGDKYDAYAHGIRQVFTPVGAQPAAPQATPTPQPIKQTLPAPLPQRQQAPLMALGNTQTPQGFNSKAPLMTPNQLTDDEAKGLLALGAQNNPRFAGMPLSRAFWGRQ